MYFKGMPPGFFHSQLDVMPLEENKDALKFNPFSGREKDFCLELFSNESSDTMLYNFCKSMKLFIREYEAI